MQKIIKNYPILIIVLVCIVSRLPQLVSSHLILDGDECVVGLMSKHMLQNNEFPLFFWGQTYGFSTLECLFILPFYLVIGISSLSVKLAMLALWTVGVVLLYKTFLAISKDSRTLAFILILIFILNPAWAVWSMKARGGYLTAFTLSSLLVLLLFHPVYRYKKQTYLLVGFIAAIVFEAQKLWLPGIFVFCVYTLFRQKDVLSFIIFASSFLVTVAGFYLINQSAHVTYSPVIGINMDFIGSYLLRIPNYLYSSLHGNYYFETIQGPNLFCAFFAFIASLSVAIILSLAIYFSILRRWRYSLFIFSTIPIIVTLLTTISVWSISPRYLLPTSGSALLSICILLSTQGKDDFFYRVFTSKYFLALPVIGFISLITFYSYTFCPSTQQSFSALFNTLKKNGVKHVCCTDELLSFQLVFYSNETIVSRPVWTIDRYPPYTIAVDSAISNNAKVAIVGYDNNRIGLDMKNVISQDEFFICKDPHRDELTTRRTHIWW